MSKSHTKYINELYLTWATFHLSGLASPTSQFLHGAASGQNGPAHGSEPLSSPAQVGQSARIWRVVAGKMYVRALNLLFELASTSSIVSARTDQWKAS